MYVSYLMAELWAAVRSIADDRCGITSALCDALCHRLVDRSSVARRARRLWHTARESDVYGPGSEWDRAVGGGQLRSGSPLLVRAATGRLGWSGWGHPVVGARPGCLVMV